MRKVTLLFVLVLCAALVTVACSDETGAPEEPTEGTGEIVTIAEGFIDMLAAGQYQGATQYFDAAMTEELTPAALEQVWTDLEEQVGDFAGREYDATDQADGYRIVLLNGSFEDGQVVFRVTFDDDDQIAGFFIQ